MVSHRPWIARLAAAAIILASGVAVRAQTRDELEKQIVRLTNAFRTENDRKPLKTDSVLMRVARDHALNMARQDRYGDDDRNGHVLDGKDVADRVKAAGYAHAALAENVGYRHGYAEPAADMVDGWKKSPGHRKNMLDADLLELGVGAARGKSGRWYFVQVFGRPASAATKVRVQIENRTEHPIEFRIDAKEYSLKPGFTGTYTHTKSSGKVGYAIRWPAPQGKVDAVRGTLVDGTKYAFVQEGKNFDFKRVGKPD